MTKDGERRLLRILARRVRVMSADPVMEERRSLWKRHNSLQPSRPMLLVFPEGSWVELLPENALLCEEAEARDMEYALRQRIYYYEHFRDDTVIETQWSVPKVIHSTGWGVRSRHIESPEERGAWRHDPVILEPADLAKIRFPEIRCDERATEEKLGRAQDLFGDILDVRVVGVAHVSYHLMNQYTEYRGFENMMIDIYESPSFLHDAMNLLAEGHEKVLAQYREQNLLSLNNNGTYHSSGGNGYTDELPAPGFDPAAVRPKDMWASAESQELALVGPEHHAEFALRYEKRLLAPFGLNGYGCCEDLTRKLDDVFSIPNIRRISISPWADVERCAARLKGGCIYSWKPQPADLVGGFDEERIRRYVRRTLEAAKANGCILEIVLKDTHTCEHRPERFDRWLEVAMQEIERSV